MLRICENCARKLEASYIVDRLGAFSQDGSCSLCFRQKRTALHEITRPVKRYRVGSGGGERARAERRSR